MENGNEEMRMENGNKEMRMEHEDEIQACKYTIKTVTYSVFFMPVELKNADVISMR